MKHECLDGNYRRMNARHISLCLTATITCACDPTADLFVACKFGSEFASASPPKQSYEIEMPMCPTDGCGGNSPLVGGVYFDRLNYQAPFEENSQRVQITGVKAPPDWNQQAMQLELVNRDDALSPSGDHLRGRIVESGALVHSLQGTQIAISVTSSMGEKTNYVIQIADEGRASFWIGSNAYMTTYTFLYAPASGSLKAPISLCPNPDKIPDGFRAVVFSGDLYDPETKQITIGDSTKGWLNIACAESAIWKVHRIAYNSAAQEYFKGTSTPIKTGVSQRGAMLNAWTANVCGSGRSFTAQGEEITLEESLGLFHGVLRYSDPWASPEAIWTKDGAYCLSVPRRIEDEPDICQRISNGCHPPPCSPAMLANWKELGYVLTGNLSP